MTYAERADAFQMAAAKAWADADRQLLTFVYQSAAMLVEQAVKYEKLASELHQRAEAEDKNAVTIEGATADKAGVRTPSKRFWFMGGPFCGWR